MKSYKDLEKICYELKKEVEKIYSLHGIDFRLMGFDNGESLSIIEKDVKDIVEKIKISLNSMFVGIYYFPDKSKNYYELLNFYDYSDKSILQLTNYFNALLSIVHGEYSFFFDALGLYEGSLNEICFDIITKAFYDARTFNMKYQDKNNYDIGKILLFQSFDKEGNTINNKINIKNGKLKRVKYM